MTSTATAAAPSTASPAPASRPLKVAVIGNPNTGKSTLFNALAGLHTRVGNYPGVTVEKKVGRVHWDHRAIDLIDLPGTYSLSPRSLDEMVSVDVLLGRQPDVGPLDAVLCIADASHLERHLFLLGQVLDTGLPTILVLNMWDTAQRHGVAIDVAALSDRLGIPVVTTSAHRRIGIDDLRRALLDLASLASRGRQSPDVSPHSQRHTRNQSLFPVAFHRECDALGDHLVTLGIDDVPYFLRERMLLDSGGAVELRYLDRTHGEVRQFLADARTRLAGAGFNIPFAEAQHRYRWAHELLDGVVTQSPQPLVDWTRRLDALFTHRVFGLLIFAACMFVVFQAIYAWAEPLMAACEAAQGWISAQIESAVPPGPLRSLLVDGVVAGVGGVLIFLPQIMLLFAFIAVLEDCGYMARAAYMMDRVMAAFGLSGKSFLPLMSSFACAIPGIMATRVIDSPRDRMVTILVAPLMSCSARLPVYLLLIGAFIPAATYLGGWVSLPGLVLFAMTSLGAVIAIPIAWFLRRTFFRGESGAFVMELPEYKVPSPRLVLYRVWERGLAFVTSAGTLIFATTILVWAAGYFPGDHTEQIRLQTELESLPEAEAEGPQAAALSDALNHESATLIESSYLGRAGHAIEPLVKPLGWDWRIGVGVIASFPAREVIIATLGTIYSLGGDVDEESEGLRGALKSSTWPDGSPVFNVPVALSVMVFFALCAQCASTLMIIRRETNSWRWPVFSFVYMTALAYVAALLTYQVGSRVLQ
jgi:ferrous iron transport protein B